MYSWWFSFLFLYLIFFFQTLERQKTLQEQKEYEMLMHFYKQASQNPYAAQNPYAGFTPEQLKQFGIYGQNQMDILNYYQQQQQYTQYQQMFQQMQKQAQYPPSSTSGNRKSQQSQADMLQVTKKNPWNRNVLCRFWTIEVIIVIFVKLLKADYYIHFRKFKKKSWKFKRKIVFFFLPSGNFVPWYDSWKQLGIWKQKSMKSHCTMY